METFIEKFAGKHAAVVDTIIDAASIGWLNMEQLEDILSRHYGGANCYPGEPTQACHAVAYFVALQGRLGYRLLGSVLGRFFGPEGRYLDPYGPFEPFDFAEILDWFVRHMQGRGAGVTRHAVIVTDAWDAKLYERWRANIVQVRKTATVEIYLVAEGAKVRLM